MEKLDPSQIFDPSLRGIAKTKQIFKVTKEPRNRSSASSSYEQRVSSTEGYEMNKPALFECAIIPALPLFQIPERESLTLPQNQRQVLDQDD